MLRPGCVPLFCDVPRPWVLQPRLCGLGCHGGVSGGSGRVLGVCAVDAHIEDAFWVVFFVVFGLFEIGCRVLGLCWVWAVALPAGGCSGLACVTYCLFVHITSMFYCTIKKKKKKKDISTMWTVCEEPAQTASWW